MTKIESSLKDRRGRLQARSNPRNHALTVAKARVEGTLTPDTYYELLVFSHDRPIVWDAHLAWEQVITLLTQTEGEYHAYLQFNTPGGTTTQRLLLVANEPGDGGEDINIVGIQEQEGSGVTVVVVGNQIQLHWHADAVTEDFIVAINESAEANALITAYSVLDGSGGMFKPDFDLDNAVNLIKGKHMAITPQAADDAAYGSGSLIFTRAIEGSEDPRLNITFLDTATYAASIDVVGDYIEVVYNAETIDRLSATCKSNLDVVTNAELIDITLIADSAEIAGSGSSYTGLSDPFPTETEPEPAEIQELTLRQNGLQTVAINGGISDLIDTDTPVNSWQERRGTTLTNGVFVRGYSGVFEFPTIDGSPLPTWVRSLSLASQLDGPALELDITPIYLAEEDYTQAIRDNSNLLEDLQVVGIFKESTLGGGYEEAY